MLKSMGIWSDYKRLMKAYSKNEHAATDDKKHKIYDKNINKD